MHVYIYMYACMSSCIHAGMLPVFMLILCLPNREALLLSSRAGSEVIVTVPQCHSATMSQCHLKFKIVSLYHN